MFECKNDPGYVKCDVKLSFFTSSATRNSTLITINTKLKVHQK